MRLKAVLATRRPAGKIPQRIFVIGFMASGKTLFAEALAKRIGYRQRDCDAEIVRRSGKSVAQIFESRGEKFFRRLESRELQRASRLKRVVVSTGGGVVLSAANRRLLKRADCVIWLKVAASTVVRRVKRDSTRPLLRVAGVSRRVRSLLRKRERFYRAVRE